MSGLGSADEASSAAVWEGVKDPPDSKVGDDSPAVVKPRRRGKKSGKIAKDIRKFLVCSGPVNTGCPGPSTPKDLWGLCFTRNGRTRLLRPLSLYLLAARQMISSQLVWRSPFQAPLVFAGLCSALICEGASSHSPRYNTIVMLALVAAVEYPNLPPKSVRPQITLAIITALSCALDVFYLLVNPALAALYKGLLAVTVAGKGAALYTYLTRARNTLRARKYLVRRVRLFGIPIAEPRRLGRDIRGRFLALAIIQLLCCLSNLAFFIVLVTSMGYSDIFLTSRASGISLPTFVLLKSITSFALFVSLALDSDPVLALAYFGCLGWMMGFVKDYTRKKRLELGGWPYPFFYNETRYTFFIWGKMLDCLWGVVGWVIIGGTFGSESATMESGLKALLTLVGLTLVLSDIWTPLLMLGINWLLRRRRSLRENEVLSDSDDSELDELAIRDPKAVLPHPKSKHRHKGRRRQKVKSQSPKYISTPIPHTYTQAFAFYFISSQRRHAGKAIWTLRWPSSSPSATAAKLNSCVYLQDRSGPLAAAVAAVVVEAVAAAAAVIVTAKPARAVCLSSRSLPPTILCPSSIHRVDRISSCPHPRTLKLMGGIIV